MHYALDGGICMLLVLIVEVWLENIYVHQGALITL